MGELPSPESCGKDVPDPVRAFLRRGFPRVHLETAAMIRRRR